MRLFVAIDLPDELQDCIHRLQVPLRHLKWEPPERMHLTLQFLGEQPDARLPAIFEALEGVEFDPFPLCCQGVGQFRSGVIWLGVDPEPGLERLHRQIRSALRSAGFEPERRRFLPHITLARCPQNRLVPLLDPVAERFRDLRFCFDCDTFSLKSSVLKPTGALHRIEALFAA